MEIEIHGDGSWPWMKAFKDGNDIVVRGAQTTWFGGPDDSEDDSQAAIGMNLLNHPNFLGCALPIRVLNFNPTKGSPLPHIPWHHPDGSPILVHVFCHETSKQLDTQFIDIGPSKYTHHGLDLTQAAYIKLRGNKNDDMTTDYRIIGAAAFL